ncbi:MAG TPA: phytanoyl-CoA dioxygenase family protein [Acetobacteraceae bacterium]|nr:phytanoyl-CoA dioxygenase family protein [Acetobacteraceae bacterium]
MTVSLSPQQRAAYERAGILFPIRVMPEAEAAELLSRLQGLEAREGGRLSKRTNQKPHLLVPWINALCRNPLILDAVESVIGPDILVWGSGFFGKKAGDGTFISWHQDSTYWGLSEPDIVTAWVALTPSTPASGCMQVIPGTHTRDQVPHRDTFAGANLLSRGQEIAVEVDRAQAVDVVLRPGEMSLHHVRIFHGSEPNRADHPRVGLAIRYIPTRLRQVGARTSAMLVRGTDAYGNFDPEPSPEREFSDAAVAFHAATLDRTMGVLYAGADEAKPG